EDPSIPLILLFMLSVLCQTTAAQSAFVDASTLSVNVRMVEIYASVVGGDGKRAGGLSVEHFAVMEDGKRQVINLFEPQAAALTPALLIDTTGSMTRQLPH